LKHRLDLDAEIERTIPPEFRTSGSVAAISGAHEARASAPYAAASTASAQSSHAVSSAEYILSEIKRHKGGAVTVLGVIAVALVTAAYFLFFPRRAVAIDSIAVLPLVNASGDPNADYLSDGISESLINNLAQLPKLRVLARSTVFRYKGKEVDPQKVGRELGVRAVLTGRVQQREDNLVIQADLIDVSDGSELWGEQYNRSISDLVAVQQDIAREITTKLRLKLSGEEEKQLVSRDSSNTEAYQLYLKGRYYWNKRTGDNLRKSIDYFQQAIDKDPNYALAYTGLADAYNVITNIGVAPKDAFPKARTAAEQALKIDDSLAEAHSALATCLASYDWDWPGAEHEFRRALQLNPNYATAHYFYGFFYLVPMGRLDDAIAEMKRAQELEPLSLIINTNYGATLTAARRYDEAIAQIHKALEINPDFGVAHLRLSVAYAYQGRYDEAIAEGQKARELLSPSPSAPSTLGNVYAMAGRKAEAQKVLDELKEQSKTRYVPAAAIASIYAALGDKEQAFAWLGKSYEERNFALPGIKNASWDPLRSDPRFADLLRRMGLPP
jgi:TolB-like protein/Tfp pilus assembly protein PilF